MTRRPNGIPRSDLKYITPEQAQRIAMRPSRGQAEQPAAKGKNDVADETRPKVNRWHELAQIRDEIFPTLSQSESLTLMIVWSMADARSRVAKVSKTAIENRSAMSRATVKRALRSLIEKGLLKVIRRGTVGGQSNYYRYQISDKNLGSQ